MKLALRIVALEDRTPIQAVPMDAVEALAMWLAMEAEDPEPDPTWLGLTAHQAWAKYQDCLNG